MSKNYLECHGIELTAYASPADGVPVIEIDTPDLAENERGPMARIYLNDDCLFENPPYPMGGESENVNAETEVQRRFNLGLPHHHKAIKLARAISKYLPNRDIRFGGDGDLGEDICYALSAYFEREEKQKRDRKERKT